MTSQRNFSAARRIVVKIGSALLTGGGRGLDQPAIESWVLQIAHECKNGREVVLVSSGSVAEGMSRLGWSVRPQSLHELQAAAAVGQMGLVQTYETLFAEHKMRTAQILLTHDDLANRQRYLNARSTLLTLLELKVVPIINENDTVATDEIRFGDNDTLAALVGNLLEADLVLILTDIGGLYERDPGLDPTAQLIREAPITDPALEIMAGGSRSGLGRGGMQTKIRAAKLAARSGSGTVIAAGREPNVINRVLCGETLGTYLIPGTTPLLARKRWMAGQLNLKGAVTLDDGAVAALCSQGKSLLPIGVTDARGEFVRGDLIACLDSAGHEIGRGLANYDAAETRKILRQPSGKIQDLLGYVNDAELIHRDNLVLSD